MQGSTGELPRKRGQEIFADTPMAFGQASFSSSRKAHVYASNIRDEATKKLNLALQFAQKESFDGSKDLLDLYLKETATQLGF